MNRVNIIGNGFDLAHGLKTSYKDFILSMILRAFNHAASSPARNYTDDVFKVVRNQHIPWTYALKSINDFCYYLIKRSEEHAGYTESKNAFDWDVNDRLFRRVIDECNLEKWVDVENEFYQMLVEIPKENVKRFDRQREAQFLNSSMDLMKLKLSTYLQALKSPEKIHAYESLFFEKTRYGSPPIDHCILDYNYTHTSRMYDNFDRKTIPIIHIHGEIGSIENPIVFGFGDYLDKQYSELEQANANALLDNIKSIQYKRTNNLSRLKAFLQKDSFEVQIFGHSCGLSDRTTLNRIFNHENCRSIKICHYAWSSEKTNYTELTQEISRHFPNKELFEDRVLPFDNTFRMPQFSD